MVVLRIEDADASAKLRGVIRHLTGCDRFPGAYPVSLDRSHFDKLASRPYVLCEKTDGVRYLLVCCTLVLDGRERHVCALVDRAMQGYLLALKHVPTAMFQGSVLDGEMVHNRASNTWEFVAFDAVCVSGVSVMRCPLADRMDAVSRVLEVRSRACALDAVTDVLTVRPKAFWSTDRSEEFRDHMERIRDTYAVDGIVFTPAVDPVVYGRHDGLFKLKFGMDHHTVDFKVADDGVTLLVFDRGRHVPVARARDAARSGSIVECRLSGDGVWEVVKVRTDKDNANDMLTFQKTLLNIRENLGMEEVLGVLRATQARA